MAHLVLSVIALCLLGTVLPGVLSQKKCRKGDRRCSSGKGDDYEVWLFHFGPADIREEYLDPLTGEVKGYNVDILNAVCEIADKDCRIVYDLQKNCWDNIDGTPVGGYGVFNFYYDACVGWLPTYTRLRTFLFTYSFSKNREVGFVVPAGLSTFDPTNLTGKKIGFIRGFFTDPGCIAQQGDDINGSELSEEQIYDDYPDGAALKDAILSREVDAGFVGANEYGNDDDLDYLNDDSPIFCSTGGPALMTRKDNPLNIWWNSALEELLESDKYSEICDDLVGEHGHKPGPERDDVCLDTPAK